MRSARHAAGLAWLLGFALTLAAQTPSPPAATSTDASPTASTNASPAGPVLTVTPGELLILELEDSLHTGQNQTGDYAHFSTVREVVVGYQVVIPPGSNVRALLTEVKKPGRAGRSGQIAFRFEEIILPDGTTLPFEATLLRAGFTDISSGKDETRVKGEGATSKRDILTVASGAGQGAIIGVAVGGGKGAAYGGAIGAGVGLLQILLRRGPHLDLPRGMFFEVELNRELPVPQTSAALFTQQGQRASRAGVSAPSSSASSSSSSTGAFRFPDDPDVVPADREVPIPDFPEDDATPTEAGTETETAEETTTVASRRQPAPALGAPADLPASIPAPTTGPPPPPGLDPTLGDPGAYRLKVDVRLVMVEAFVRDDRGRVIEDLTREDFRLLEDNVEQEIRHFSRDELPLAVALVVDRSGSVAQFMPELRRAAYETLSQLKSGDQVALFAFAGDVDRLTDLTTDRRYIAERISRIRAGGGTNITDALAFAATYLAMAAPDRRRTIILISDSQETTRGSTSQSGVIRIALESEVVIYGVKTPGEPAPLTLRLPNWLGGLSSVRKIAEESGGEEIDVRQVGSLQAALAAVVSRLKTRYTIGYQSTNKTADGAFRRIEVKLTDAHGRPQRDYQVFARRGYYAPIERRASQPADNR